MRCLELADEPAADPAIAGAKAAGLARALAAGLPVLPGVIVPAAESRPVVEAASRAMTTGRTGAARLAAMRVDADRSLVAELNGRLQDLPRPLIVRSSSPLEADGTWSGAFSSFHGVTTDEVEIALRGCWGSAFAPGVLERAARTGTPAEQLGVAVLVQPELDPDVGGVARLLPRGAVQVTATAGPLRPLMSGEVEGVTAVISAEGSVETAGPFEHDLLRRVGDLVRATADLLGHDLIEWAAADGRVTLLQSIAAAPRPDTAAPPRTLHDSLGSPLAQRLAALTHRFNGPLADELVLRWAVAVDPLPVVLGPLPATRPVAALGAARAMADELTTQTWGGSPRAAAAEADRALRQLRGDDPWPALAAITTLRHPNPAHGAKLLELLSGVQAYLGRRWGPAAAAAFWRLTGSEIDRLLAGEYVVWPGRLGISRWEPFLHDVVATAGKPYTGIAAAPGNGAGTAWLVGEPTAAAAPADRYVIVASEPSPALAPLLWNAAGLVTRAGNPGAHLIEFARSIGVPAVVQCAAPELSRPDPSSPPPMLAVDGNRATVSVARLAEPSTPSLTAHTAQPTKE